MFDIGWGELVVIGIVALIAIGPKELPTVLRTLGQWMGKVKRMAAEFQGQFQEALREAELHDLKKQAEDLHSSVTSATDFTNYDPLADADKAVSHAGEGAEPRPSPRRRSRCRQSTCRCRSCRRPRAMKILHPLSRRRRRRPSRPGAKHEPRGHRGHQSAADGAPGRAALAADQGGDRLRPDVRTVLHLRQGHLQRAGVALRLGGGAGKFEIHLHGAAWNISSRS